MKIFHSTKFNSRKTSRVCATLPLVAHLVTDRFFNLCVFAGVIHFLIEINITRVVKMVIELSIRFYNIFLFFRAFLAPFAPLLRQLPLQPPTVVGPGPSLKYINFCQLTISFFSVTVINLLFLLICILSSLIKSKNLYERSELYILFLIQIQFNPQNSDLSIQFTTKIVTAVFPLGLCKINSPPHHAT